MSDQRITENETSLGEEGLDWIADATSPEYEEYAMRESRLPRAVGIPHLVVIAFGIILGLWFLSWPFVMQMEVERRDESIVNVVISASQAMSQEEHDMRLAAAQMRNASISGWIGWPASVDNADKGGKRWDQSADIPTPDGGVLDIPEDQRTFDMQSPLDVGNGLIGWLCLPTGRRIPISDDSMRCPNLQNAMKLERWSSLPVGGYGSLCVLTLGNDDTSFIVEDDLLRAVKGSRFVMGVLGDMYAYEVSSVSSGSQSEMIGQLSKQRNSGDSLVILVGKDTSGMLSVITANRVRQDTDLPELSSPIIETERQRMLVGMAIALASTVAFVVLWRLRHRGKDVATGTDGEVNAIESEGQTEPGHGDDATDDQATDDQAETADE